MNSGVHLSDVVATLEPDTDFRWAWHHYRDTIISLSQEMGLTDHLEIGGGRVTLFTPGEAADFGFNITINDISAQELSMAPEEFDKALCDIGSDAASSTLSPESYDLVYSKMVMEHVANVPQMWRNTYDALRPGGVAVAFYPTLFAPPFVVNHLIPEKLSGSILRRFFPDRGDTGDQPKFPALYSHCYGSMARMQPLLDTVPFQEVVLLPFYGYSYMQGIPGVRQGDELFTRSVKRRDARTFTSFAYLLARK